MGGGRYWSPAEDALLRELYPSMGNAEVSRRFAAAGFERSADALTARAKKLGVAKDEGRGYRKPMPAKLWTEERAEWFRAFVPGHTEREISAEHERIWGFPLTESQIGNAKAKFGLHSGTTGGRFERGHVPANKGRSWHEYGTPESRERCRRGQFKPGNRPRNAGHLLDERTITDGEGRPFVQVKVDPRDAKNTMDYWIGKERFVWMQANGQDWPEGCNAVFVDGDRTNFDPENVYPVPRELYPLVQGAVRGQMPWHDRETLELAILNARVTRARVALRKRVRA